MERDKNRGFDISEKSAKHDVFIPRTLTARSSQFVNVLSQVSSLSKEHPNQILLTVLDQKSGILSLLNERSLSTDVFLYIIIILGKACSSDMTANVNNFMLAVNSNSKYILLHMQVYLVSLQKRESLKKCDFDSMFYLTVFLEKFQSIMPSSSSDFISVLLPLLNSTAERCLKMDENMFTLVSEKLKHVNEQNQHFLGQHKISDMKRVSEKERLHLQEPPESFRLLPVLPTADDIASPCVFLRPNIVKGKYKDTEHYLDVQYRLLREDYVRPLRDGIAEYLSLKETGKSLKTCENVKVYTNVRIVGEDFLRGDLLHVLKFSDDGFSKIKWDQSKRLLTQSLLCLSLDNFKTMLFASVIRRDPEELEKGLLFIRFEEITEEVLNLNQSMEFVVLETSAYFESYRHNLIALQQLNTETLPLKAYIIDVQKAVGTPQYLQSGTTYDMTPLFLPLDKKRTVDEDGLIEEDSFEDEDALYECRREITPVAAASVSVLDDDCWPTADEFNLDQSQYMALKSAITKEFSVIQGPPGTGKTYIGLRIVQLLLHNLSTWFSNVKNSLPILIVCYTNHALDQFLEGLLLFTSKIVRIGGRCKNPEILKYQLRDLQKFNGFRDEFPLWITHNIDKANFELREIKREINKLRELIEMSSDFALNEWELNKSIPRNHLTSLEKRRPKQTQQQSKSILYVWLGIGSYSRSKKVELENKLFDAFKANEKFESKEENDDIEYIESQRDVHFYDFDELDFGKKSDSCGYAELKDSEWSRQDSAFVTPKSNEQRIQMQKYVKNCLEYFYAMPEEVAMKVKNVWSIDYSKRWELYKFWLKKFVEEASNKNIKLQESLKTKFKEIEEMRTEEDLCMLKKAHVVGMTTSGSAKYRNLVQRLNPAILIVEEAAELLESHVVTSLAPNTQHVILIGDQQQLRPSPTVHTLAVKYDLNVSLFERMIMNGIDYCRLSVQHRMRPEVAALIVPHIYPNLENHKSVTEFESIKGVEKNVFFVSHCFNESSESDSKSKVNEYEAKFLIRFCRYLLLQGYDPSKITVLTTYSGQLFVLKNLASDDVKKIRFTVVDNFQGEENDIILISFVRSNDDGTIGFLKISNRVCVALSRARKGLFCIGNFGLLAEKSNLWKNIVDTLNLKESIGPSLRLMCQNHPHTCNVVASDADFDRVPEGGCTQKCEYRLPCGHSCYLMCHPYNQDHEDILCKKPCTKICERGHPCKMLCFEECYCKVIVFRTLSECEHTVEEMCGKPEEDINCTFECKKKLRCGHACTNTCGELCIKKCLEPCLKTCENGHQSERMCFELSNPCDVLVDKTLERCGHTLKVKCGERDALISCTSKCNKMLRCTHPCPKQCGETCETHCKAACLKYCLNGHQCQKLCCEPCGSCEVLVDKTLAKCGHIVKIPCNESSMEEILIICSSNCEKKLVCGHNCTNECGKYCVEKCTQLKKTVLPTCGHSMNVPCYIVDSSDILFKKSSEEFYKTCPESCREVLPCGHICSGTCGSCYQKRLHVPCMEACERILICGHKCRSTCSRSCPPCQNPCGNKCIHSRCLKKCGQPCCKCTKPCEWFCIHKKCTRLCYEACDREPCSESCEKILPCGHPCIGFCGEPCPEICRNCDNEAEKSIFYAQEVAAKYVLLEDCGHVFEVQGLDRWMTSDIEGDRKIRLKTCPMCKTVIRSNLRYNFVVKSSLSRYENIKKVTAWDKERNQKLQSVLLQKSVTLSSCSYFKPYNNLNKCLSSNFVRSIKDLTSIENVISIGAGLSWSSMKHASLSQELPNLPQFVRSLTDYADITSQWMAEFILKYFLTASEHQLLQLSYEAHRLGLIGMLLQCADAKCLYSKGHIDFENCSRCLLSYAPFRDQNIKDFTSAFRILISNSFRNESKMQTLIEFPYLKAMDMSAGHWYECSKGHAYCIAVHAGTIAKGCYECKKIDVEPEGHMRPSTSSAGNNLRWPRSFTSLRSDNEYQASGGARSFNKKRISQREEFSASNKSFKRSYPRRSSLFQSSDSRSTLNWRNPNAS